MERFVVLLVKDALFLEEQTAFFHCIKICHPCKEEKNYCNVFAPHFSPFMEDLSLNVAVIRAFQVQNPKDITWNKVELDEESIYKLLNSEFPLSGSLWNPVSNSVFSSLDETSYFPEVLHSLADHLPVDGTYHCDIIISQQVLEGKILRDHAHFAAALCRFRFWHNAKISIVRKSGHYDDSFVDWYEGIDSHVITAGSAPTSGTILWRGGIQIGSSDASGSAYIHGFQLELQTLSDIQTWSYVMDAASVTPVPPVNKGALIVSSKLEVLDDCDLSTIPPYVMTPLVFHLSLTPCYNANEEACQFLQFLKSRPQVAFILRLQYSQVSSPPQKNAKISDKWNDFSSCNDMHLYDPVLPPPKQQLNFVLTKGDCINKQSVVAYLMRDVDDIKGDFYHNIAVSGLDHSDVDVNKSYQEEVCKIFSCGPRLNVPLNTLVNVINKAQLTVLNAWLDHKKSTHPEDGSITTEEVRDIFSSVQNVIYSKFIQNFPPEETNNYSDSDDAFYEPTELSACPEKIFLMQQQILKNKNKEYGSSDTLGGLPPPTLQKFSVTVAATDVMNLFTSSGEASNLTSDIVEILPKWKNKIISYTSSGRALNLRWPDVLHVRCHDMYYNRSNYYEDLEAACNKTVLRCITNETATTYNNQLPSSNTPLLSNSDMSSKENSFPQNEPNVRMRRNGKRKYSSCEDECFNLKAYGLLKKRLSNQTNSSSSTEELLQIHDVQNGNNIKCSPSPNFNVSLRRSPRKLARVNYKQSQCRTKNKKSEPVKAPDDLSEKHKMKLRDAVAAALEQHGIGLDHPSFKSCGRKLFAICKAFVKDIIGKGSTSAEMKKIALAHVKQVVEFEMQKGS